MQYSSLYATCRYLYVCIHRQVHTRVHKCNEKHRTLGTVWFGRKLMCYLCICGISSIPVFDSTPFRLFLVRHSIVPLAQVRAYAIPSVHTSYSTQSTIFHSILHMPPCSIPLRTLRMYKIQAYVRISTK